jgi:hypothetical protein
MGEIEKNSHWSAAKQRDLVKSGVNDEAFERLKEAYGSAGRRLHQFWLSMVILGEDQTKTQYSRAPFDRNKQSLDVISLTWLDAQDRATTLLESGDETLYRLRTKDRYVTECLARGNRARKFSTPLFMTPTGYIESFPEVDEHLFVCPDSALKAVKLFGLEKHNGMWCTSSTTLRKELNSKNYLRWAQEVKPMQGNYTEPRRTLENRAAIYKDEGLPGLKDRYTKSHAFNTRRQIVELGLGTIQPDE